jgi:hypothetical protein
MTIKNEEIVSFLKNIFNKTFGGLSSRYYVRQLFFASIFFVLFLYVVHRTNKPIDIYFIAFLLISTLLYPYARFVYESIVEFIMGDNIFSLNVLLMLCFKLCTMNLCWVLAMFISPIGLAYLYYQNSKTIS